MTEPFRLSTLDYASFSRLDLAVVQPIHPVLLNPASLVPDSTAADAFEQPFDAAFGTLVSPSFSRPSFCETEVSFQASFARSFDDPDSFDFTPMVQRFFNSVRKLAEFAEANYHSGRSWTGVAVVAEWTTHTQVRCYKFYV